MGASPGSVCHRESDCKGTTIKDHGEKLSINWEEVQIVPLYPQYIKEKWSMWKWRSWFYKSWVILRWSNTNTKTHFHFLHVNSSALCPTATFRCISSNYAANNSLACNMEYHNSILPLPIITRWPYSGGRVLTIQDPDCHSTRT